MISEYLISYVMSCLGLFDRTGASSHWLHWRGEALFYMTKRAELLDEILQSSLGAQV